MKNRIFLLKSRIPQKIAEFAKTLPYPLYIVGGTVRDCLAGLDSARADIDICAPADAGDFSKRAKEAGFTVNAVYKNTGTVKISAEGGEYEFASFRSDRYIRGEHSPASTYFTDDIALDARRRDFKCNAVYFDISAGQLVDPLGGIDDIAAKRVTTVAPAEKVFGEDGLRLMRLARISAQIGFTPTEECLAGAKSNAALIKDISAERVFSELNAILLADEKYGISGGQYRGLRLLKDIGVLEIILPELAAGDKMFQKPRYHDYDVLEHSLKTVLYADGSVRLAALLHDVGKPVCAAGDGSFIGHEAAGAEIAENILKRLKAPTKVTDEIRRLTALHMYDGACTAREMTVRKFIVENYDILEKLLLLKQADFSACKDDSGEAPTVTKFRKVLREMKEEGTPLSLKELKVSGGDLKDSGFSDRAIGETLKELLNDCVLRAVKNEREALLARAVKIYLPKAVKK